MKLQSLRPRVTNIPLDVRAPVTTRLRGRTLRIRNARIAARDLYTCQACGRVADKHEGQVDHRMPLAHGGSDDPGNLQWLCIECHRLKTQRENAQRGA